MMTATALFDLAKNHGWREKTSDLSKGHVVLRAQNGCIAVYYRVRPGQGCRDIFARNRLKMRLVLHQISFNFLCQGSKPHVIGPFGDRLSGKKGFNLITCRFQPWEELP